MGQAFSWIRGDDDESPHPLVGPDSGAALPPHAAAANNASSSADGRAGSNAGGGVAYGRSSVPRPMTNRPGTNRPDIMGSTPMGMTAARVAVIGGGVSGASLVFALRESIRRNQIQVTVFDEGTFTGGRAGTHRHSRQKPAGLRVDHGAPDFFASTTVFTRLCHDLYEQGVLKLVEDDSYWAVLRPDGYFWPDESSPWLSSTAPSYQVDHHFSHMSHPTFPISHILILFESPAPIFNGTHSQNQRPHAPPTPPCPINAHTPSTPIPSPLHPYLPHTALYPPHPPRTSSPYTQGKFGMATLSEALLRGGSLADARLARVQLQTRVAKTVLLTDSSVHPGGGWALFDQGGVKLGEFDWLVVTSAVAAHPQHEALHGTPAPLIEASRRHVVPLSALPTRHHLPCRTLPCRTFLPFCPFSPPPHDLPGFVSLFPTVSTIRSSRRRLRPWAKRAPNRCYRA